jgi:outer membrane receptor protein involved in Fe transport
VDQEFPIVNETTGFAGAQVSLVGNRLGEFAACNVPDASPCPAPAAPRDYYPSYTQTNLHAGMKSGPWTASLFANNVTDKRGLLGGGAGGVPPGVLVIIPPRTIGLNLSRTF